MDNMCDKNNNQMEKYVDRILDGYQKQIVKFDDKSGLSIKCAWEKDNFAFKFKDDAPYTILHIDEIKLVAEALTGFVKEINRRRDAKKYRDGDKCYTVARNGVILENIFQESNYAMMAWLYMGNLFKTRKEAQFHRDEIVAKYAKLKEDHVNNG